MAELVHNGANVNFKGHHLGESPLHMAIATGDVELVRLLIAHGADVNAKSTHGDSPLYLARNSKVITELLKEHGAR